MSAPDHAFTGEHAPVLFVAKDSDPGDVAGKAAHTIRDREAAGLSANVILQAIGAGAVNQAVKASIIARAKLGETGHRSTLDPTFHDQFIGDLPRTAIRFLISAKR